MAFNISEYHQNMLNRSNINRVFTAIENNNIAIVNEYISANDINTRSLHGQTLLHYACRKVKHDIVQLLLNHDADPNIPDTAGDTTLSSAIVFGDIPIIQLLLQHNVNINGTLADGTTPLMLSVLATRPKFELLLSSGANIHLRNNMGRTALHEAAYYGDKFMVKILLKANANPNIKDNRGWTPRDCAEYKEHNNIVKLFWVGMLTKSAKRV